MSPLDKLMVRLERSNISPKDELEFIRFGDAAFDRVSMVAMKSDARPKVVIQALHV
jgi:hypothetical protein